MKLVKPHVVHIPELNPFTLLTFQTHGHHAPGEVFHALLVGQLGLGPGIQPPDLSGQRVFFLHLIGAVGCGMAMTPFRKERVPEQAPVSIVIITGSERGGAGGIHGVEARSRIPTIPARHGRVL